MTEANTYRRPGTKYAQCRVCRAEASRRWKQENHARLDGTGLEPRPVRVQVLPDSIAKQIRRYGFVRVVD